MNKTIVIPDIHGRDIWRVHADLRFLVDIPNLATEYKKYIFLGDYTDSFNKTNVLILHNLKEIIRLKKNYPDNVILLIGNHDVSYIYNYDICRCSGFRPEAYFDLHELFTQNIDLFQPIYQEDNYIFSHAGISTQWLNAVKKQCGIDKIDNIGDFITEQYYLNNSSMFSVGAERGGFSKGGIFWADKSETMRGVLPNYHQVVGHTPVKENITHKFNDDSTITYCDTTFDYYEL